MEQEYVDAVMRGLQGTSKKAQVERFRTLSVRMGVAGALAKNVDGEDCRTLRRGPWQN